MASDLLVTSPSGEFQPPTRELPFVYAPEGEGRASGLLQKLVFLRRNLVLGWAGNTLQARAFARYLDAAVEADNITLQELSDILCAYPEEDLAGISAFVTFTIGDGSANFDINTAPYSIGEISKLWCLGTGAADLYPFAEGLVLGQSPDAPLNIENPLIFLATSMLFQSHSGFGLENHWGGGLQFAIRDEFGFRPLDKILIRGWVAVMSNGEFTLERGPFFYLFYQDDRLLVCRVYGADGGSWGVANSLLTVGGPAYFPYGSHSPDVTIDLVWNKDINGSFSSVMLDPDGVHPVVYLREEGFYVDSTGQEALTAQAKSSFESFTR